MSSPACSRAVRSGGPGITHIGKAGFLFHRPMPVRDGSYLGSAGVYALRPTGGEPEQVPRGVHITVHISPHASQVNVRSASVRLGFHHPHAEHVLELGTSGRRRSAARRSRPSCSRASAAPAEPLVGHGAGEPPVARHARHVQVLGHDRLVPGRRGPWWPCATRRHGRSPLWRGCGRAGRPACGGSPNRALREWARLARRSFRSAARSGLGPGNLDHVPVPSAPVSSVFTPRSMPIAMPGRACRSGMARSTSTVNDTNHR